MKGGITGEIKMAKCLYIKGSELSDGRDGALFVITPRCSLIRYPYLCYTVP